MAEYFYPGLTTNELPLKEVGIASANKLIGMLEGEDQEISRKPIKIDGTMILRNSVARLS